MTWWALCEKCVSLGFWLGLCSFSGHRPRSEESNVETSAVCFCSSPSGPQGPYNNISAEGRGGITHPYRFKDGPLVTPPDFGPCYAYRHKSLRCRFSRASGPLRANCIAMKRMFSVFSFFMWRNKLGCLSYFPSIFLVFFLILIHSPLLFILSIAFFYTFLPHFLISLSPCPLPDARPIGQNNIWTGVPF